MRCICTIFASVFLSVAIDKITGNTSTSTLVLLYLGIWFALYALVPKEQ